MLRVLTIAAILMLALTFAAVAQGNNEEHRQGSKPGGGPSGAKPFIQQQGPTPGAMIGPHPGGPPPGAMRGPYPGGPPSGAMRGTYPGGPPSGAMIGPRPGGPHSGAMAGPHPEGQFTYRGRAINQVHVAPFTYPQGWGYRRWAVGAALPPIFLVPDFIYTDWPSLGIEPPPPGCEWVRYGPDLLLVDMSTGQIIDVTYDVFY
jgi:Nickel/cobalt transporter regulator